ncbi:hypothetical protein [Luteipulveratus halotolerans]|uniref:hypothetical protein n=1 Tax=Luteipulveratus halotolerans TaxID=1631356 RepID=UPI0008FBDAC0|nr:hypothetical protein [Luteipulveratus halotolerans]
MSKKTAGAFDIRNIIAMLIGIYGVVLVGMGFFSADQHELDKADGMNINLWAGFVMVVVAALLFLWSLLRPVVIPPEAEQATDGPDGPRPGDRGTDTAGEKDRADGTSPGGATAASEND